MPQMSALMWFNLYLYFFMLFMILIFNINFFMIYYNNLINSKLKIKFNNYLFMW